MSDSREGRLSGVLVSDEGASENLDEVRSSGAKEEAGEDEGGLRS